MNLQLEMQEGMADASFVAEGIMMTPPIDDEYWLFRVRLTEKQAMLGFPKFGTIGIGFAVEDDDWNTNLPYPCPALKILTHILDNKGDDDIRHSDCLEAIIMIQEASQAHFGLDDEAMDALRLRVSGI